MGINCAENREPIEIYGPVGLRKFIRVSLGLSQSLLGFSYSVNELHCVTSGFAQDSSVEWTHSLSASDNLHPNETSGRTIYEGDNSKWQVCQEGNLTVFAAPLKHRVTCFGYVIQEQQLPGKLDPDLLKLRGISPGPLYGKIKNGETVTAPDGSLVMPADVLGPPRPGRKVVILGDTCDSSRIMDLAFDADIVVHEATLENELMETCIDHGHSTPEMAGYFAAKVQAKKLVLTHFSQRYMGVGDKTATKTGDCVSIEKLLRQAEIAFKSDSVIVAEDFLVIKLPLKH